MKTRSGPKAQGARPAHVSEVARPAFAPLKTLPSTVDELFQALAITVESSVVQSGSGAKSHSATQRYALPWVGFDSWHDARLRLEHFEKSFKGKIRWAPFNDSESNDGPMSLNAFPGRAFIERVTNEGDANLEMHAARATGTMPSSPSDAVARWFGLKAGALATGLDKAAVRKLAQETVTVSAYVGDPKDSKDCILDARDRGIGLTADEMPGTILSLNRGLKKTKAYLTGKHGQGASSTYQYSDLTLIASRKVGAKRVAFTLVEGTWDNENGVLAKTPTYRYLTIDGRVPEVDVSESEFPHGTLVRHIGYLAADLFGVFTENSLYGLLMRSLAEPVFPVWLEMYTLRDEGKAGDLPMFKGYRRFGRAIVGTVNSLERAWDRTQKALEDEDAEEDDRSQILHRASEYFQLPEWDFGARIGRVPLGSVRITYWVADPKGRKPHDVVRSWVDPDKTILLTLDGQTHAEESSSYITGQRGAKLWAAGKYMVVQIDCNGLHPRAKYEMFTSTREHAKETPIKKMILDELVRRLELDQKLKDLNVTLAAANINQTGDVKERTSALIKKYLKAAGLSFEQMIRKVEKWVEVEEEMKAPVQKRELVPIAAVEPPTFVRWRFNGTVVKLHPGQRYSYLFETDASPSYWNPADPAISKLKVTAQGLMYLGSGDMKGGRVRCHFECPPDAAVGSKKLIQVQLDIAPGQALTSGLPVEVVERPAPKPRERGEPGPETPDPNGVTERMVKVKIRRRDLSEVDIPVIPPIPVKRSDPAWNTLSWPFDPERIGFSIRLTAGKIQLYYNAEFPPFLDLRNKMSRKSLEEEFVHRYELKLVLHTIFSLNYEFVDEDEFNEEQKKRVRNLLCATAESLALATKAELELEAKIKSEDHSARESETPATVEAVTAA
jgi:hypothetical protein